MHIQAMQYVYPFSPSTPEEEIRVSLVLVVMKSKTKGKKMTSNTPKSAEASAAAQSDDSSNTSIPADNSSAENPITVDTLPVIPHNPIAWEAVLARLEKDREEKAKNLAVTRDNLRSMLMGLGVTKVQGEYDGYGDSGNTECVSVEPSSVAIDETLDQTLANFIWDMAYQQSPGFENNDGAFGTFAWDVTKDTISIEHNERFTDYNSTVFEDL